MLSTIQKPKLCRICGKDIRLDHCVTDEHGLPVHQSCQEKRMLLEAASLKSEEWRRSQPKVQAA